MSVIKPTAADDPRDASLEVPFSLPKSWNRESNEAMSSSGMFFSGMVMVTRNRYLAWPAVLLGINNLINAHPMRSNEGAGWSNIGLCFASLLATYIPVFVITKDPSTPLHPLPA